MSLTQVIKDLTKNNLLSLENCSVLKNFPGITEELAKRKLGKKIKYSPELRKFAVTLSFFPPEPMIMSEMFLIPVYHIEAL